MAVYKDNSAENIDGWYDEDQNAIYLNTNQPLMRRRFTVAHELGHYIMGHSTRERNKDEQYNDIEANRFAAALLMPAPAVKDCVFRKRMLTRNMAEYFGVSTKAMIIRLRQLGYVH
ncbi:MAG: ImmA/IrrE family metallo-endopeptidase [Desulfovibrionaceae bacterium]|nr:ImmA/IrrE family metallo-endopeptidase [Desulfovibrionaceae bacterium]